MYRYYTCSTKARQGGRVVAVCRADGQLKALARVRPATFQMIVVRARRNRVRSI
jgi:hypothetical protein